MRWFLFQPDNLMLRSAAHAPEGAARLEAWATSTHASDSTMKICIYGAGAIGGHVAVRLARAGHDVSVVARGAHLAAIQANGLTLDLAGEQLNAKVAASDDADDLGPQEFVIVTVKATDPAGLAEG